MKVYSVTKYFFQKDDSYKTDWLSISDIGKEFNGKLLTPEEYWRVEDAYVEAIMKIVEYMNLEHFNIKNVYRCMDLRKEVKSSIFLKEMYTDSMIETFEKINEKERFGIKELADVIRLKLREDMGGLVYVPYRLKIYICYDFMMDVAVSKPLENIFNEISNLGLNIFCVK